MKRKVFVFVLFTALTGSGIFWSCQKDEISVISDSESTLKAGAILLDQPACDEVCIDLSYPEYFLKSYQDIVTWGGNDNNKFQKTVDVMIYNTATDFVIKFKSSHSPQNLYVDDEWILEAPQGSEGQWFEYTYPLEEGWAACDLAEHHIVVDGQGPQAEFDVRYELIGICTGCVTEMTGAASCDETWDTEVDPAVLLYNRKAEYTYTAEIAGAVKMQGGLTNFTPEDATVMVNSVEVAFTETETTPSGNEKQVAYVMDGETVLFTVKEWVPGNSSNRIISVEGDLAECETVNVTVKWLSENGDDYITGDWTASGPGSKMQVDQLMCGEHKDGYEIID